MCYRLFASQTRSRTSVRVLQRFHSILNHLCRAAGSKGGRGADECLLDSYLMVTIDVEADSDKNWGTPEVLTFRNVLEAIPNRLQPLFAQYGVKPTYLISPEVLHSADCCAVLRNLACCELGTHLHVEDIPPEVVTVGPTCPRRGMQWECRPEIEQRKLQNLTRLFTDTFGSSPRSFRAGRFGVGHHTGKFLMELGYRVDSSVTPNVRWKNHCGVPFPDFTNARELPYWVAADGDLFNSGDSLLLEVPLTIGAPGSPLGAKGKSPVWFRPWYTPKKDLQHIVRKVARSKPEAGMRRPLVMMFHSMEVVAGASPYPQTKAEVEEYLDVLKAVFDMTAELGIKCCTLSEYWQQCCGATVQSKALYL